MGVARELVIGMGGDEGAKGVLGIDIIRQDQKPVGEPVLLLRRTGRQRRCRRLGLGECRRGFRAGPRGFAHGDRAEGARRLTTRQRLALRPAPRPPNDAGARRPGGGTGRSGGRPLLDRAQPKADIGRQFVDARAQLIVVVVEFLELAGQTPHLDFDFIELHLQSRRQGRACRSARRRWGGHRPRGRRRRLPALVDLTLKGVQLALDAVEPVQHHPQVRLLGRRRDDHERAEKQGGTKAQKDDARRRRPWPEDTARVTVNGLMSHHGMALVTRMDRRLRTHQPAWSLFLAQIRRLPNRKVRRKPRSRAGAGTLSTIESGDTFSF